MTTTVDRPGAGATRATWRSRRGARDTSAPDAGAVRTDPAWARPALWVLLAAVAVLYLWDLSVSGNANSFYAAAVQAGTKSWKAMLFGSLDAGNSITVDKPPASLWVMDVSGRIFGFNSWSLLVPQALEGVASVAVLAAAVRRWHGAVAGLVAGAGLALVPAAVLIFRFDNPDALLVLLMTVAAYAVVRAVEVAGTRWLLLAGVALGFAFLTKMLQGFLVLPAFGLVYLVAAPTTLWRRVWQLLLGGVAIVVSAGWYVALVELWPASSRPYIGGSTDNSLLQLTFGYNGLSRITGGGDGGGGGGGGGAAEGAYGGFGGGGGAGFGGSTGLGRLFSSEMANEASWLLPAALVALLAGLWFAGRAPRTDRTRASVLLWGGWLLVTGGIFSYASGIIHPYYTVALAPAIAALVAIGGREAWARRSSLAGRAWLAAVVAAAAVWAFVLLGRDSSWLPALRWVVLVVGLVTVAAVLVPAHRLGRHLARAGSVVAVTAVLTGLLGTGAFAVATAARPHSGGIPNVGPTSAASATGATGGFGGTPTGGASSGTTDAASGTAGDAPSTSAPGGPPGGMDDVTATPALTKLLAASTTRWAAAVIGGISAAPLELSSDRSVIAIGGFGGGDPSPTLAQFQSDVAKGEIHYFIGSGSGGGMGPDDANSAGSQITSWVKAHYTATTVGGQTVYDLTAAAH